MSKVEYIDQVVNDLNALQHEFHGIPLSFNREIVLTGVNKLGTDRERHAFSLRCEGFTLDEIGKDLGVSRARAGQIMRKVERKLKGNWMQYYTVSIADADKFIRREVNQQICKYIADDQKNESSKQGHTFNDFAAKSNLSVRTYNCVRRAGIDTVEELIGKTTDEVISWKNFGRKSYEELVKALSEVGLSLREAAEINHL